MKVLVVGAAGFVGSNLNILNEKFDFHGIDFKDLDLKTSKRYSTFTKLDFLSQALLDYVNILKPDYLILLAGVQFESPIQNRNQRKSEFEQNTKIAKQGSRLLSQFAEIKKLIYVSTDMVYGIQFENEIDESFQPSPIGEYGESKLSAEKILGQFDSRVIILRPRLIVGPGRVGTIKLLSKLINSNLPIPLIGNGNNRYQMLSVFDLWGAIEKCLELEIDGVFNLGSNNPPTLNELMPKVLSNLNRKNRIIRLPKTFTENLLRLLDRMNVSPLAPEQFEIAGQNCVLSTEKFKSISNWEPKYSDEEILTLNLQQLLR